MKWADQEAKKSAARNLKGRSKKLERGEQEAGKGGATSRKGRSKTQ